ncbi:MAG: orotidine-5'-phosphate decarboxylase, partial [Actinomycetes bacterium]
FVSVLKLGLETYLRDGRQLVVDVAEQTGRPVFLDLKLHDIPNTVAGAARSVADLRPAFLTVHACGGSAMIRAAVDTLPDTKVTAVTVLTSLSPADLDAVGLRGPAAQAVLRLAALSVAAGATALVCSPLEVAAVRAEVGPDITLITPGVRPATRVAAADDQARTATPQQALASGADLLVVGRPITAAPDPADAARQLRDDLLR